MWFRMKSGLFWVSAIEVNGQAELYIKNDKNMYLSPRSYPFQCVAQWHMS